MLKNRLRGKNRLMLPIPAITGNYYRYMKNKKGSNKI
jgi:hypothetical protein